MVTDHAPTSGEILFLGKDDRETCQFYFRQHWIRLLKPFLVSIVWSIVVLTLGFAFFEYFSDIDPFLRHVVLLFLAAGWAFTQLQFLARFYRYFLNIVVVTDKKIHRIKKTLVTFNDHESIDLWLLHDVNTKQHGPVQNLLGFGTLICEAQDTDMRMHFVPNIGSKYAAIMKLREGARDQMTLSPLEKKRDPTPSA